ncbi:MAG: histidine phosphatase family protein [Crocinitomicaceae bacterium]|nr:histidine phosphatase family protein [Crocinitomicaceae bacterium]
MKLHILRHAKTEDTSHSEKDVDRRLHAQGIDQAKTLRGFFESITSLDEIWCSNAQRTRQTSEIVLQNIHPTPNYTADLYMASKQNIIQKLWRFDSNKELLIIGHNFGISDLVNYFTDDNIQLNTGEYVCLEFNLDSWTETSMGTAVILDQYRP